MTEEEFKAFEKYLEELENQTLLSNINKSFPGFNLKGEVEKFKETGFEILECNEAFPKMKSG